MMTRAISLDTFSGHPHEQGRPARLCERRDATPPRGENTGIIAPKGPPSGDMAHILLFQLPMTAGRHQASHVIREHGRCGPALTLAQVYG